ncbi:MAG: hypothetical protein AAF628_21305 [Planctomycetota bacterium]
MRADRLGARAPATTDRAGIVLLTVLFLSTTFVALSLSLLATAESAVRALSSGRDLDRAERAAQSGVEWAAAQIGVTGIVDTTMLVPLETDVEALVQITAGAQPNVLAEGRARGATVTLGATVGYVREPLDYAFASFADANKFKETVFVSGKVYLGDPTEPIDISASDSPALDITGDLHLVMPPSLPSGTVDHHGMGSNTDYDATVYAAPVWDTTQFETMTSGMVTVHHYSGATTIKDQTLDGIVVVALGASDKLKLENATINGTLVVPTDYDVARNGAQEIELKKTSTINGGTALTGNLAILAPHSELHCPGKDDKVCNGVVYVESVRNPHAVTIEGQLLVRFDTIETKKEELTITRSWSWRPDVPLGLEWPAGPHLRIDWAGRQ